MTFTDEQLIKEAIRQLDICHTQAGGKIELSNLTTYACENGMSALQKHLPKMVINKGLTRYCPTCGNGNVTSEYCPYCGQHLSY